MIDTIKNYTDPYGITHESPVFAIAEINAHRTENYRNKLNRSTLEYSEASDAANNVNYTVVYWPSAESRDAGNVPLNYIKPDGESSFYFNDDQMPDNLISACEDHFVQVVF